MMKLLLDQGLPRTATAILRQSGVDAIHVGEIGAAQAADSELLDMAREQGRIIVTLDADFHALLALSGASSPSVIRVRIEGLKGDALAALLDGVLSRLAPDLEQGIAVTVQEKRIRLRRLPLTT